MLKSVPTMESEDLGNLNTKRNICNYLKNKLTLRTLFNIMQVMGQGHYYIKQYVSLKIYQTVKL